MKKHSKSTLFAGAAAGLLGMIGFAGSALAFDTVNWDWQNVTLENVAVDGQINLNLDPTGLVQLEKMQVFIGDAIASSDVHNINNIQPTPASDGKASFTVSWAGTENDQPNPSVFGTGILGGPQATLSGDLTGSGDISGTVDEGTDAMQLSATFTDIPVSVAASDSYDALTQLPEVASAATAVGNNQSIASDVGVSLHDAQFVFGGYNPDAQGSLSYIDTGNTSLSAALAFVTAGGLGMISPATIQATSNVSNIINATVDSNATAVANNASVDVTAASPSDALVMADYVQGALANVSAASTVTDVSFNHYTDLGNLGRPIVNSAATAVGNNLSIKVTGPTGP